MVKLSSLLHLYTAATERSQVTVYFNDSSEPAAVGPIDEITQVDGIVAVKIACEFYMFGSCSFYKE